MSAVTIEPTGSKPNKAAAGAKQAKRQPKGANKRGRTKAKSAEGPAAPGGEGGSKKAEVIALLRRAKGVTIPEIQKLTGWQKHTVRGFVSLLGSKGGLKIISTRNDAGERSYRVSK
jgi:Protein of unknown function (DUF3489)